MTLPTLFVPHGAPTFALRPGAAGAALVTLAQQLERPKAVIVVSPHWETQEPRVGSARDLELAQRVAQCLQDAGYPARIDPHRGLDHGAWVPLRMMYSAADIPVIPLSIKPHAGAAYHYVLGQALIPLAAEGFLIIGTGSITHNLRDYMVCVHHSLPTPDYVSRFANWIDDQIKMNNINGLIDYRNSSADASQAHPTEDHFMPFFVALGAAGNYAKQRGFTQVSMIW